VIYKLFGIVFISVAKEASCLDRKETAKALACDKSRYRFKSDILRLIYSKILRGKNQEFYLY